MKTLIATLLFIVGIVALFGIFMSGMPGTSATGAPPALDENESAVATRLRSEVDALASEIGTRGTHQAKGQDDAADYLGRLLRRTGCNVTEQSFDAHGVACRNIVGELRGRTRPDEILVFGAHYDSAHRSPGADANASGAAVLTELAHELAQSSYDRTLRFVFFANGEPPLAGTEFSGSYIAARKSKSQHEKIVAMVAFDGLGCFKSTAGSQSVPFPLSFFYPDRGDFVAFVGNFDSREVVRTSIELFRRFARVPSEGGAFPSFVPGVGSSDHAAYWDAGYKAFVITDTGSLRNPNAQRLSDTADRVDIAQMARIVIAMAHVAGEMARKSTLVQ